MAVKELDLEEVRKLSLADKVAYWKSNLRFYLSWRELELMHPKAEKQETKKESDWNDDWRNQLKYSKRKTIASQLGKQGLEQAYNEIYGKADWEGIDFGKKKKMQILRRLLDSENLSEVVRSYYNYFREKRDLLPDFDKLESYVRNYINTEKKRE